MISLRQLSISVARTLADGEDAANRAALVKDLGTRFEQDSVELVGRPAGLRRRTPSRCARCWPPRACTPLCSRCAAGRTRCCAEWSPRAWACDERLREERGHDERRIGATGRRSRPPVVRRPLGHRGLPEDLRRGAVAQSGGDRAEPADQQPGRRTRGGGDRAVRLGQTCGRGSDRRDRSARGVAGGQGWLSVPDSRPADRGDRRRRPRRRPDQRNRAATCRGRVRPRSCWRRGPPMRCMSRFDRRPAPIDRRPQPGRRTARVGHVRYGGRRYRAPSMSPSPTS